MFLLCFLKWCSRRMVYVILKTLQTIIIISKNLIIFGILTFHTLSNKFCYAYLIILTRTVVFSVLCGHGISEFSSLLDRRGIDVKTIYRFNRL